MLMKMKKITVEPSFENYTKTIYIYLPTEDLQVVRVFERNDASLKKLSLSF
jgi:hypothetical protein